MADGEIRVEVTGDAGALKRELRGVESAFERTARAGDGLGVALRGALSTAAGFIAANVIQDGLRAITGAIGDSISKAADFEQKLNVLQAVSGATAEQMAQVSAKAKALGADITIPGASAMDAAAAMTELAKAGLSVEQSMAAAKGTLQLAAAGQLDTARAAEILGGALNAFKLSGDQAVKVADLLSAAANASAADVADMADSLQMASAVASMTNVSIEDTIAALSMLANAGIKGSDAGTSLKTMLMRLMSPSKDAAKALSEYGISIYDAEGKMKSFRDIVQQFSEKLVVGAKQTITVSLATPKMAKEAQKASQAIGGLTDRMDSQQRRMSVLQAELANAAAKYGEGSTQAARKRNAIADLEAQIRRTSEKYSSATATIDAYNAVAGKTTTYTRTVTEEMRNEALAAIFGADAIRAASLVLSAGVDSYDKMAAAVGKAGAAQELAGAQTKGAKGALEAVRNSVDTLALSFGEKLLGPLTQVGLALAEALARPEVIATVERMGNAVGQFAADVVSFIGGLIASVQGKTIGQMLGMSPEAEAQVTGVIQSVLDAGRGLVAWVTAKLPEMQATSQRVISAVQQVFDGVLKPAIDRAVGFARIIVDWVVANWPLIYQTAQTVANAITDVVQTVLPPIVSFVQSVMATFGPLVEGGLRAVLSIIQAIMQAINGDWQGAWQSVQAAVEHIWRGIQGFFAGIPSQLAGLGAQMIHGLIGGINSAAGAVRSAVEGAISSAIAAAKSALGIRSPSRVFAEIGRMAGAGYIEGLHELQPRMQLAVSSAIAPAPAGNVVNNNYYLSMTTQRDVGSLAQDYRLMRR